MKKKRISSALNRSKYRAEWNREVVEGGGEEGERLTFDPEFSPPGLSHSCAEAGTPLV